MAYQGGQPQQGGPVMEHEREPCPDRILDDVGGAFAMGAVGGGIWHTIKGMRNSPSGHRFKGALQSLRKEAPRMGGSFANWGLTFSAFDCTLQYIRKKEDPWNAIIAGAATGGFLQLRLGLNQAARSAAFGGFLLALIEGLGIALSKMTSPPPPGVQMMQPGLAGGMPSGSGMPLPDAALAPPAEAPSSGGIGSFISSFFSGDQQPAHAPSTSTVISEDAFKPPEMPDFSSDSFQHHK